ncbi:probable S-adenosylmethionine-dependent methyltransferase At5g38100 [Eucalyptus grandis]|uniref:probable S-adenosylmethionine-dependent methyltransferase At5g38100 n=1 Tax=Eucalyptus grandis TaxID=71139 RepID=UPI0008A0B448|nr:probable S-adenosylmethionine-dependent methyltransferase At5g38100 [Eucalyptus grandis]
MYDLIGLSLMDMAKEGIISEEQVDCFNMPLYPASPREIAQLVKMDGSFHIEKMELLNTQTRYEGGLHAQDIVIHLRAGLEGIISKHFRSEIIDELFRRLVEKTQDFSHLLESSYKEGTLMFIVLKRH